MRGFLNELRRRNVVRVALGYAAMSWLIVQVLETVLPIFELPSVYIRWSITALAILSIPVLAFSWAFGWSVTGIASQSDLDRGTAEPRPDSRRLDRVVIALLSLAVLVFAVDKFLLSTYSGGQDLNRSVAVLPFVDLTETQEAAYFGDGLAEDLLNLLARNTQLKVAARRSSFSFRDSDIPVADISKALGVAYVLEGSVRGLGDRIQVSAQLVSAADGFNIWSNTFDRDVQNVFSVKEEILDAVVTALDAGAPPEAERPLSAEAYVLFLKANYLARDNTVESKQLAVKTYLEALDHDPNFAEAWGNLATVYLNQTSSGDIDNAEGYRKARDAALKSVESDPRYAGGYKMMSAISRYFEGDMPAAVMHMQRALDEDPTNYAIIAEARLLLLNIGQLEDAVRASEYLTERSPVNLIAWVNMALHYRYVDRLEDSENAYRRVLELNPEMTEMNYHRGETLLLMGRFEEALALFDAEADDAYRLKGRALALFALGETDAADEALNELIERFGEQWPSEVVHVLAYRGEINQAFEWLEKEFDTYGPGGWGEWQLQRLYDNLRDDPRWNAFLARTGTAPEQLAALDLKMPTGLLD